LYLYLDAELFLQPLVERQPLWAAVHAAACHLVHGPFLAGIGSSAGNQLSVANGAVGLVVVVAAAAAVVAASAFAVVMLLLLGKELSPNLGFNHIY
jgi:hypothetical protein